MAMICQLGSCLNKNYKSGSKIMIVQKQFQAFQSLTGASLISFELIRSQLENNTVPTAVFRISQ